MLNITKITMSLQELDNLISAALELGPDHVSGGRYHDADVRQLRSNLMFVKAVETPADVSEWVDLTEKHYASVASDVADELNEHRLGAHEYGLTRAA